MKNSSTATRHAASSAAPLHNKEATLCVNIAQNLALTRNTLLAVIPFDENTNLPTLNKPLPTGIFSVKRESYRWE